MFGRTYGGLGGDALLLDKVDDLGERLLGVVREPASQESKGGARRPQCALGLDQAPGGAADVCGDRVVRRSFVSHGSKRCGGSSAREACRLHRKIAARQVHPILAVALQYVALACRSCHLHRLLRRRPVSFAPETAVDTSANRSTSSMLWRSPRHCQDQGAMLSSFIDPAAESDTRDMEADNMPRASLRPCLLVFLAPCSCNAHDNETSDAAAAT
jgi:hypothetical protein